MTDRRQLVVRVARAAAVALAVVVVAAVTVGPRFLPAAGPGGTGSGDDGTPTGAPQESPRASPLAVSPSPATRHISTSELGLDVPADWTGLEFNLPFSDNMKAVSSAAPDAILNHGLEPILTVGTGSLTERCANPTPQQRLAGADDATCIASWTLPAGGVQLRLVFDTRQGTFQGCCRASTAR